MQGSGFVIAELKRLMKENDITVAELARMAGIPQSTTHRILVEQSKSPKWDNLNALAKALGTDIPSILRGERPDSYGLSFSGKMVPLYTVGQLNSHVETNRLTPCHFPCGSSTFAFLAPGDPGMANPMQAVTGRSFPVGSIVFVDPAEAGSVQPGDVVAARVGENQVFTFRVLVADSGVESLQPLNPSFVGIEPARPFVITGKVIGAVLKMV